jgi:transposase
MVIKRGHFSKGRKLFTELTDSQWEIIKSFLEDGRKRKYSLRTIFEAILKITRTGIQWRELEEKYPPWESVYYYFRKWQKAGSFGLALSHLVELERVRQGKEAKATRAAVDSQSVKKGAFVSINTGIDGGKLVNGRKRHIAVDSLGLPLAIFVGAANVSDTKAGIELLWQLEKASDKLKMISADNAYRGYFSECAQVYKWTVEITQKPESEKGFVPQSGRWQVERSFAWLNFFRRLAKDYEKDPESSASFVKLAYISIILARFG